LTVDGSVDVIEVLELKNCPGGCYDGACKPIQSNMPIEIYIFFSLVGVGLMLVSFFKKGDEVLMIKWITVVIFTMIGVSSFNLNRIYCEHTSSGWDCFVHQYTATNLAYLWFGLAAVMLIFAIMASIRQPAQVIADNVR
jgi:hypothetical protein